MKPYEIFLENLIGIPVLIVLGAAVVLVLGFNYLIDWLRSNLRHHFFTPSTRLYQVGKYQITARLK